MTQYMTHRISRACHVLYREGWNVIKKHDSPHQSRWSCNSQRKKAVYIRHIFQVIPAVNTKKACLTASVTLVMRRTDGACMLVKTPKYQGCAVKL